MSDVKNSFLDGRYLVHKVIGEGGYGVVSSATDLLNNNEKVVVKHIRGALQTSLMAIRILRELKLLRLLCGHENIIEIKNILVPSDRERFNDAFVVFELRPCNLSQVITSRMPLSPLYVRYLMFQLLCGIRYLHNSGVLHRDLKPSNLLVDDNFRLKICDFGLSRAAFGAENDSDLMLGTNYVATRWYRAPELIIPRASNFDRSHYGRPIDMWSAGCIFADMILGYTPFPGENSFDQLRCIIAVTGKPDEGTIQKVRSAKGREFMTTMPNHDPVDFLTWLRPGTDKAVVRLISKTLQFNPGKRITAHDALMHEHLNELRESLGLGKPSRTIPEDEFEFEKRLSSKANDIMKNIRRQFLEEIAFHHPEKRKELLGTDSTYLAPSSHPVPQDVMEAHEKVRRYLRRQTRSINGQQVATPGDEMRD